MSSNDANEQASNISNLQESFSKQQKKISALKELVRKSDVAHGKSTSTAQEKVKNIAQRLTHLKIKARSRQNKSTSNPSRLQVHENVSTSVASIPFLEEATLPPPPQKHIQLSHSFSFGEQKVSHLPHSGQITLSSTTSQFAPLKQQHRSESSKSLSSTIKSGSEKVQLLRQQMEQNKLLMAQRASSKQHLEQLVSQLKEKFDTTQQCLEDTSELGKSMSDLSALMVCSPASRERHKSATDLSSQPFSLEKERMKFLENRCRLLEKQLEKERQLHSNQETAQHSNESVNQKRLKEVENKVVELEKSLLQSQREAADKVEETKQLAEELERMRIDLNSKDEELYLMRMRQDEIKAYEFSELVDLENNDIERLRIELTGSRARIKELEEINDILEVTRCDLALKNNQFEEELASANKKVENLQEELQRSETNCASMEMVIEKLQNTTKAIIVEPKIADKTIVQVNEEMAKQIQELSNECDKLLGENRKLNETLTEKDKLEVSDASIAEKITALEATIEGQRQDLKQRQSTISQLEEKVMEKTIELNVLNANFKVLEEKLESSNKSKSLFSSSGVDAVDNEAMENEIQQFKQKLDESNKAMIKLKLKCKQTEKQVERLKKTSDLHAENVRLESLNEELQRKITQLEDQKDQRQLTHAHNAGKELETANKDNEQRNTFIELEERLRKQLETINLLEQQKYDQTQQLEKVKEKLRELQAKIDKQEGEESARVISEISEVHFEEQVEEQALEIQQLEDRLSQAHNKIEEYKKKLADLQEEKQTVDQKLEKYIVENMELLDKIEKLSKSSSSAESIEIVERLTQQERAEIDEYNKALDGNTVSSVNELTQTEMSPELSDSLVKLRDESSELMSKIELFTTERREVLERMEHLTTENYELIQKVEELQREKEEMETNMLLANDAKIKLEERIKGLSKEKDQLAVQVAEFKVQGNQLSQELSSLQKSSEVVAALDSKDDAVLIDKCEKCLTNLSHELEIYRKAGDRNAKFNASKKLAKEAKNAHTQLTELLQKIKEASTAVETVTVVETVVAVTAPNGKALAEYEQLTTQNRLLKQTIEELRRELEEVREADIIEVKAESTAPMVAEPEAVVTLSENETSEESRKSHLAEVEKYEAQCVELQSTVENLRLQLMEARTAGEERSGEISQLNDELEVMKKTACELEGLLDEKNLLYVNEVKEVTRLRKELEGKCDTYEGEMTILQTLIAEQKQQLIEGYKEHEQENEMKLLELQQRDEQILQMQNEIKELKHALRAAGNQLSEDLLKECDKLREALKINKNLVAEQLNELSNKQETIEALNQQIIDLYKTMEENANKVTEKDDEINRLQKVVEHNRKELEILRKDNDEQKIVVDKLLIELHSHRTTAEQIPQLENDVQRLQLENQRLDESQKELQKRNKEQLEKLKKYAANLKKRTAQCQELEAKLNELDKGSLEALQTKAQGNSNTEQSLMDTTRELEIQINELKEQIQLKSKTITDSNEIIERLNIEMKQLEGNITEKNNEIVQLQIALVDAQEQASGWGDSAFEFAKTNNAENDNLTQQLEEKAFKLKEAATEIYRMQEELIQLRQSEREKELANKELEQTLLHKNELIGELQQQIELSAQADDITHMLEEKLETFEERIKTLNEDLKSKSLKFEKSKAVIKERNNQIQRLQAQLKDVQDKLSTRPEEEYIEQPLNVNNLNAAPSPPQVSKEVYDELQAAYDKLNERYNTEQTNFRTAISRLETLHDGIQAKLQENMAYIETLEQENVSYKDKICKLEEGIASFEERRASMEHRTNLLCAQIQTRESEHEKAEDELIYRLNMLSEHDDIIGQRLLKTQEEKDDLLERIERSQIELKELSNKYSKLKKEYEAYRNQKDSDIEVETQSLQEQLTAARTEIEHIRNEYDTKLFNKTTELDELESELSEQLSKMNTDKRAMSEDLECARDECNELKDEIVRLKESINALEQAKQELERETTWLRMQNEGNQQDQYDLQELRMQTMQDKTEIDNLRHQIETLASNHEVELQALRTQISELDTLRMQVGQNQTDDQVFIETENKRLTDLLAEKEAIIESYQRQNLQLQMAAATTAHSQTAAAQHDPLNLALSTPAPAVLPLTTQITSQADQNWERELIVKNEQIARLQREVNAMQTNYNNVLEGNQELQCQLTTKSQEIESLRNRNFTTLSPPPPLPPSVAAVFGGQQQQQQDVIPAPPFYFSNEQTTPSPFDDIVQVRNVENLESSGRASNNNELNSTLEQPTIEDLQRNVSDLEKHAQDLENKLATRNQRESEMEDRLRENQQTLCELERQLCERTEELNALRVQLKNVMDKNVTLQQTNKVSLQQVEQLKESSAVTQQSLNERDEQLRNMEADFILQKRTANQKQTSDDMGLRQLQGNLERLQQMLQQRDDELKELRRALDDEKTLKERTSVLESQIIPDTLANLGLTGASNPVPTLDMFFGGSNSGANDFETLTIPLVSDVPVVEEAIVPEKAYNCQPPGAKAKVIQFDLDDEWAAAEAWGTNEAAAEEAHFSKTNLASLSTRKSLVPREQQLEIQLSENAERIAELQLAVERCEQQKQEMQVKSGKLMKKLKEYKTKIDELQSNAEKASKQTSSFFDLDAAIQDELKMQIKQLEERLQEELKQHELHGMEKEKLLKRIDVLTAGGERMTELKERQDMEVQMYQARIQELQAKVNRLEDWVPETDEEVTELERQLQQKGEPVAGSTSVPQHTLPPSNWNLEKQQLTQCVNDLTAEIQDTIADRQELQALLEEERSNVLRIEESLRALQQQLTEQNSETLANENAAQKKYKLLKADHQQLQEKYNRLQATYEEQTVEMNRLKASEEQLNNAVQQMGSNLQNTGIANAEAEQLKAELRQTESELSGLKATVKLLHADLDEVQTQLLELRAKNAGLLQANEELLQSLQTASVSSESLKMVENEKAQLRSQNEELEKRIKQLEQDVKRVHELQSTQSGSTAQTNNNNADELNAQLQEKESEIMHLKQRIEDLMREDQTEKLVLEILTKNQEIHMLKLQVKNLEDDKQELEHNLALQITNEMQVNKKNSIESENVKLQEQIQQLEKQLQALQSEKNDMEEELKVLNNHVLNSLENEDKLKAAALQLDTQNIEIAELRRTIELLKASGSTQETSTAINATPSADYVIALNAQWEAIVEQKCGEIAKMWREHLEQREAEFKLQETRLYDEITVLRNTSTHPLDPSQQTVVVSAETTATSTPASVSTTQSGTTSGTASKDGTPLRHRIVNEADETDADAIIEKMQSALESQEMEIVTLKEQLAIRSAEYARLAAQYDPFKLQNTSSHSNITVGVGSTVKNNNNTPSSNDSSLVPKSELDFALYMLHQRDMRCEEMTLELVSLLEERDTLQLKLSNTLRQVEVIKAATNYAEPNAPIDTTNHTPQTTTTAATVISQSVSGDSTDELSQKLSQLQTVNHSKDKVIKEERDQRIRQMEKIQQDVAKMPQAAVSELVGTDAAQAGQSPSSVLLNWLWGNKPDSENLPPH